MLDNKNIIHVVIDIETLGTVQSLAKYGTCPILEAGYACVEYFGAQWTVIKKEATTFSLNDQHYMDHADQNTINWFMSKNIKNYEAMLTASLNLAPIGCSFAHDLENIELYAKANNKEVRYWAQGKDFDYVLLSAYAIQNNFTYPFMRDYNFTKIHCLRDLIAFTGHKTELKNSNPHRALSDATFEASVLAEILNSRSKQ